MAAQSYKHLDTRFTPANEYPTQSGKLILYTMQQQYKLTL
jgi:hypothetical protein